MDSEDKQFADWIVQAGYAFIIWRLGGFPPDGATSDRLRQLERWGQEMMLPYGQGALGIAAFLDANKLNFERFIRKGLDQKFIEYWGGVLVADELDETFKKGKPFRD